MRIYFAGPLFTQAERAWNVAVAAALTEAGHRVFLPQAELKRLDAPEAGSVFRLDVEGIREADALVAILDGADADSGTSFECGVAYAMGIPVVAVRTDFRGGGDDLPGQRLPGINLMLSESSRSVVHLPATAATAAEVARQILDALAYLGGPDRPVRRGDGE